MDGWYGVTVLEFGDGSGGWGDDITCEEEFEFNLVC